jgi:hypothetical protein
MKLKKKIFLTALVLLVFNSISAQKFLDKPYQKWKKDEALKLLNDSAWSKTFQSALSASGASAVQVGREQAQNANSGGSNPRSVARDYGNPPVVIRLHSALPIRQAIVRMQQIAEGYDKLPDNQKAQFDESAAKFIACAVCKDYYVVTITKSTDTSSGRVSDGIFQTMTIKDVKGNVGLVNDKSEKRDVVQFTPPKGDGESAVFFFKRLDEKGRPLIDKSTKNFKFLFQNTFLNAGNAYSGLVPLNWEFDVSKIILGEKIEF